MAGDPRYEYAKQLQRAPGGGGVRQSGVRKPQIYRQPQLLTEDQRVQTPENTLLWDQHQFQVDMIRSKKMDDIRIAPTATSYSADPDPSGQVYQRNMVDTRIQFESRYRAGGDFTMGEMYFRVNPEGKSSQEGQVGVTYPLNKIIEMQIAEFDIPNSLRTTQYIPLVYYEKHFREITLYVKEFSMENTRNASEIRHHFSLKVVPNGRYIHCTPLYERFTFGTPTSALDTISFELRFNGYPLPLSADKFLGCDIFYENPLRVHCQAVHDLVSLEDAVIFYGAATPSSHADVLLNVLGNIVQVTSTTDFVCPYINALGWVGPATINMFVLNRNIKMTIRFRSWTDQFTNGMLLSSF